MEKAIGDRKSRVFWAQQTKECCLLRERELCQKLCLPSNTDTPIVSLHVHRFHIPCARKSSPELTVREKVKVRN